MLIKKNESRFSLQFDENKESHINAIMMLNEMGRNKSNYIADLIKEKENKEEGQPNNPLLNKDLLKQLIKECLIEVFEENKDLIPIIHSESPDLNKIENSDIIMLEHNNKAQSFNKEILSGLSCFGIKK